MGQLITYSLVAFGASVVITSRNLENLKEVEKVVRETGAEALAISTDVTKEEEVDRMVAQTVDRFGKIDILVNNSGIQHRISAVDMSSEIWHKVIETNVTGAFLCSQRVGRVMIARRRGKIINLSSIRGRFGRQKDFVAYCTSKGGIDSLTRALACEWGPYNIQVNAIAPSLIEVPRKDATIGNPFADPDYTKGLLERIPLHRWGQPDDLVGSIVFLASGASNFVNGHILYVDGGYAVSA